MTFVRRPASGVVLMTVLVLAGCTGGGETSPASWSMAIQR